VTKAAVRRHAIALGPTLTCAALVRIAWILRFHPTPADGRFDDTAWYRAAAHYVAAGAGYVNPYTATPTAAWPPGYPVFLGAAFKLFGESDWTTYGLNVALAVATVAVVYAIGLAVFDRPTAIVGALAMAIWPGQVYFASLTLSEPLFTLLFTSAALLVVLVPRASRGRGPQLVSLGIVIGLAALTRGQALLLLPLALLAWRVEMRRWRPAIAWVMLAALATAVVIAPWVARNQRELGSPVIIATNLGPNVWIGNHADATGRMRIPESEPPLPDRGDMTQPEFEVAADRLALRKGLGYALTHPLDELRLAGEKTRAMYESDATAIDWNAGYHPGFYDSTTEERWLRGAANGFWFVAMALAGIGLFASRERAAGVLAALLLLWTAGHLPFFGDARFHYPIVFAVALLAARGVVALLDAVRRPQPNLSRRYARA
jgi:4-amino-4-deoxy-L-arabinose transferase-like glycosyltransferase